MRLAGSGIVTAAALAFAAVLFPAFAHGQAAEGSDPAGAPRVSAPPEGSVGGMGDVNLYPKRVVIDGRQRIATVGLYNRSAAAGEYQISIEDKLMQPDGSVVDPAKASDPAQLSRLRGATALLRWSPRRITLLGNEAQTVRIMARTPPDLPAGEYRAHFQAISVPPAREAADSIDRAVGQGAGGSIGVTILPRFGISIPVILRVGETTLDAGIKDVALSQRPDGGPILALTVTRAGTRSAFGDISVTVAGSKRAVGQIKGLGVYTEIDERRVAFPLALDAEAPQIVSGMRLAITYTDDDAEPGKVLARSEFVVP